MKTIGGFIFLIGATACAVCAAQTPPTASKPATPPKEYGGAYSGYRRVVADGQELYCRNDVATGSHTERKAVCLTQAQMRIEQLKAQQFMMDMQRRAGSERQLTYIYGANAGMQSSAR